MTSKRAELRLTFVLRSSLACMMQGIPLSKPGIYPKIGCPFLYHIEFHPKTVVP